MDVMMCPNMRRRGMWIIITLFYYFIAPSKEMIPSQAAVPFCSLLKDHLIWVVLLRTRCGGRKPGVRHTIEREIIV